jgi:hypothetical protein
MANCIHNGNDDRERGDRHKKAVEERVGAAVIGIVLL